MSEAVLGGDHHGLRYVVLRGAHRLFQSIIHAEVGVVVGAAILLRSSIKPVKYLRPNDGGTTMSHNISGKLQQKRVYLDRIVLDLIDHLDARGLLRLTEIRGSSGRPLPAYGSADLLRGPEA